MPPYRAFEIDDSGHVSATAKTIEAKSDIHAIVQAMQIADGKAMEIWDETRRVGLVERRENETPHAERR